ncbi:MAG: PAS domain-containing protein [Candidatus Cryosericum sp.]
MSDTGLDLFDSLDVELLLRLFDTLPVDVSFVNADDEVVYFNLPIGGRIFPRTRLDIGRKVQRCHPPQSVDKVQRILDDFRAGKRVSADFWLELGGKFIFIRYFSVFDRAGTYLGTLEVSQDCTGIRALTGQKKLLDEPQV